MVRRQGMDAEQMANSYIEEIGYKIIARNVTYPFGELDIVACDNEYIVFIEVKHRRSTAFGAPHDAVTRSKQKKIIRAAQAFLQKYYNNMPLCRFDVISLVGDIRNPGIEHFKDAFSAEV